MTIGTTPKKEYNRVVQAAQGRFVLSPSKHTIEDCGQSAPYKVRPVCLDSDGTKSCKGRFAMKITNEMGVIAEFAQQCESKGWELFSIQSQFPDAIIREINGIIQYKAEFEYMASSFLSHGHDLRGCDVIICWEDDWEDCPITVWALSQDARWKIERHQTQEQIELYQLRHQNKDLQQQLEKANQALRTLNVERDLEDDFLTPQEAIVFELLSDGRVCTRTQLGSALWDSEDYRDLSGRIDKMISRFRAKLALTGYELITVRGRGYKMVGCV